MQRAEIWILKFNYRNKLFLDNRLSSIMKSNMYYFLLLFSFIKVSVLQSDYDYCIIGAGPAGLQLSYFLQKNHRKYIVFEKGY